MLPFTITPVSGEIFEETIDGYFPLSQSIWQMMERNQFGTALISIVQTPIMKIPDLAPTSPVPLRIKKGWAGTISKMAFIAIMQNEGLICGGLGHWTWFTSKDNHDDLFDPMTRLAEPAFIRGIGLHKGDFKTKSFGALCLKADSHIAIASNLNGQTSDTYGANDQWKAAKLWSMGNHRGTKIYRQTQADKGVYFGSDAPSAIKARADFTNDKEFICTLGTAASSMIDQRRIENLRMDLNGAGFNAIRK